MNTRKKIKLALTASLVNAKASQNVLGLAQEVMLSFQEVGAFVGRSVQKSMALTTEFTKETINLRFEHCTLSLELISNRAAATQVVQGFRIR